MTNFALLLKAEVENVESVEVTEDTIWRMKVLCLNCGEESANYIEISPKEEMDVPESRGSCNCVYKCKGFALLVVSMGRCKRKIIINVLSKFPSETTQFEEPGIVAKFEVRGGELSSFQPAVCATRYS